MKIAIRVDASHRIGFGHLIRCRTLATALRDQGAEVRFVCRAHPGHGIAVLKADAFAVAALPEPAAAGVGIADADYAGWRGVSQPQDAFETLAVLGNWWPDWLIVDHYGLDRDWEQALRPYVSQILVIDDLANRQHDCDLLLDQNYHAKNAENCYDGLLPAHASTLLGPRHALLRPEYAWYRRGCCVPIRRMGVGANSFAPNPMIEDRANEFAPTESCRLGRHRRGLRPRDGLVRRVLVFFGGTDPDNMTGRALSALDHPALAHLELDLVVGANNPHHDVLAEQALHRPGTLLHGPRPHLADLMSEADLAIGAGGTTTWERCCLGLPSLVVSIADNQRPACTALAADGVIQYLGHGDQVTVAALRDAILRIVSDADRLRAFTRNGEALVDGEGAVRVVDMLLRRNGTAEPRRHGSERGS
ncbi:UDP-2,4-diacetamido-2,4,6-trideoxy-beta-L-altropyranose hydrolase [uncultured Thiocystis sp.]|jgi:spore coat polysaccharide biosynthesis predicted glycosyltransferase SpsG|uniref:UDP-2,4-diacetamido-2,4, 6-trideoxy-beta-L-altropyranose hydrolase n=1 Tax=uncultured Thiocystis sp. TaxID=1202134 RepID=UPI0025D61B1C|nr:UDP-2,4-diacetamido-2,4,6-trideoxy-beta-L-altropyranose hydrolase [uncultured Thiocystis sp.]